MRTLCISSHNVILLPMLIMTYLVASCIGQLADVKCFWNEFKKSWKYLDVLNSYLLFGHTVLRIFFLKCYLLQAFAALNMCKSSWKGSFIDSLHTQILPIQPNRTYMVSQPSNKFCDPWLQSEQTAPNHFQDINLFLHYTFFAPINVKNHKSGHLN